MKNSRYIIPVTKSDDFASFLVSVILEGEFSTVLENIRSYAKGNNLTILLFPTECFISLLQVRVAERYTQRMFSENRNRGNTEETEFARWITANRQVKKALEICSNINGKKALLYIKSTKEFNPESINIAGIKVYGEIPEDDMKKTVVFLEKLALIYIND